MTSGKKRQLDSYLTEDERVELAIIEEKWKTPYTYTIAGIKQHRALTNGLGDRYVEIYTAADRRRKIENLDKLP